MGKVCNQLLRDLDRPWSKYDGQRLLKEIQKELSAWPTEVGPTMLIMAGFPSDESTKELSDEQLIGARDALCKVDNVFGKYLTTECFGSMFSGPIWSRTETQFDAARLRIALMTFEKRVGRLPNELDELVTMGILLAVPNDSFDGKPFGYSVTDRMLWSAGETFIDKSIAPTLDSETDDHIQLAWRIPRS